MLNMTIKEKILADLPYRAPFLFVDKIDRLDENGVVGTFYLHPELDFYKGHFIDYPVTPGVILTEIMAQIGLVCLGLFLIKDRSEEIRFPFVLTASEIAFLKPVYPGDTVTVKSQKIYFRFGKLKCSVNMYNGNGILVCEGTIAGMIAKQNDNHA